MNPFVLSGLFISISSAMMGIFVYLKNPKNIINQVWLLLAFSIAIWGFGAYKIGLTKELVSALFWWKITYIGIIFIPILFLHFVYIYLGKKNKSGILCAYILGIFFIITNFTGHLVRNVNWVFNSFYYPAYPPTFLYIVFIFFWCFLVIYTHIILFVSFKRADGIRKNQIKYFFLATVVGYIGGGTSFLPKLGINLYPYGNFTVPLYPLIMSYAILRYRLMDIKLAITRTGVFVFVYTLVLGLPFFVGAKYRWSLKIMFGEHWWMVPLGLMGVLATFGPYFYIYLQRKAEGRLLKEQRLYQQTLKQASAGMTRIRSLRKLLNLIAHIVTSTVKISYIAVYLYDEQSNEYVLHVSRDKGRVSVAKISADNFLVLWLIRNRDILIYDEVKRRFQDTNFEGYRHLEEEMKALTAAVIIPSFLEDKFMGFFVLGDKLSGQIYTTDDLNVFQVLASQAALAIENAKFYEEAKEMQEQISQAEKMATIGTMADGLSHQLNNRFYALSLIAGNTIDTIKMTDASKCTPEIQDMIHEINHALGRIQVNVMQGGEVVRGLLKYSRKGDVGFEALELNAIITNTIEMVQFKVRLSEIDIVRDFGELPKIKGNMSQLEEVFFNFIDNSYDSIVERRTILKEEGYRGRITISARQKNEEILEIIVEDNGMGVKTEDAKKVFTPFFTTKTSSRKGTGLGLYVIKRIITDMHKGKINFESDHKVGTRFIVELPLTK